MDEEDFAEMMSKMIVDVTKATRKKENKRKKS